MTENLLTLLKSFNRKERFFLIGMALGNPLFKLSKQFREALNDELGLEIPEDAFTAMDFHLDWIYASLFLSFDNSGDTIYSNIDNMISANQEDVDFLIAYKQNDKYHLVLLEAKGVTGFTNRQLKSKIKRLEEIFGKDCEKYPNVIPHFALISRKRPVNIQTDDWPSWILNDGEIPWIEMPLPSDLMRVTRCDEKAKADANGKFWRVVRESS